MSLLQRKRVILAKIETTYGTDASPTGAANAILVRNLDVTPMDAEIVSRDLVRPYFGNYDQLIAANKVSVSFEIELQGSGTAGTAPAYSPLLRACGLSETISAGVKVDYKPVSASFESATLYVQIGQDTSGNSPLHKVTGCRGNVEFTLNAKAIPVAKFSFVGLYNAPVDAAAITASYTAFKTPLVVNQANTPTFSFMGYTAIASSFGLNLNNDVVYRNLIGQEMVMLTDRRAGGTVAFDAPTIAAKDFFAAALSNTLGNMSVVHGTTAGSIVQFDATGTVDLVNPSFGEADGIVQLSIPYVLVPTSAGNDEFTFTVK